MAVTLHLTDYIMAKLLFKRKLNVSFFRISGSNFFQFFKAHVRGVAIESCTRLEGVAPIQKREKTQHPVPIVLLGYVRASPLSYGAARY